MNRVAEEFSLSPTAARDEIYEDPDNLAITLLGLRQFARAKDEYDAACKEGPDAVGKLAGKYWVKKVMDIEFDHPKNPDILAGLKEEDGG